MRSLIHLGTLVGVAALAVGTVGAAQAAGPTVYDAIPAPLPYSMPSLGGEAYSQDQIGDEIRFANGATTLQTGTIAMVSWVCQSGAWNTDDCVSAAGATFDHPITLNLYNVDMSSGSPVVGTLIKSVTRTFSMPYRPSTDQTCADSAGPGQWKAADGLCRNGYAFEINFDLAGVAVPAEVIFGVAYNTRTSGEAPMGVSGPYDSLNVGLNTVGTPVAGDVNPDVIFWDTAYAGNYADGGTAGVDTFRADSGWTGYAVAARFATVDAPVLTPDNCKNGGYVGLKFRNQGQCIASIVANANSGK